MSYHNMNCSINSQAGGSSLVTIALTVGQGSDIDCRYCRVQARTGNSGVTRVRVGTACTAVTGVAIPAYPTLTPYQVTNLNQLYFFGTNSDVVDIEYFK